MGYPAPSAMTPQRLLAHVNEAYARAAYECDARAMVKLGRLHRSLLGIIQNSESLRPWELKELITIRKCNLLDFP